LRIESQPPSEFQERIRDAFPLLERGASPFAQGHLPPELLRTITANFGFNAAGATWNFFSEDKRSWVSLTTDALSFVTQAYHLWEDFVAQLRVPIEGLIDIYKPPFFTRVGLRYQDLIVRSKLRLEGVSWSELLKKEILGEIALKEIEANLQDARRVLRIKTSSGSGFILLQHGLGVTPGSTEVGYMIDLDFSSEPKTEVSDAWSALDSLHAGVGRAFRWCISDRLHDAMEPVPIPDRP
jgi:uncharacterized protein (TIGR04255 family)